MGLPRWAAQSLDRSELLPSFFRRITPGVGASQEVLLDRAFAVGLALTMPVADDEADAAAQAIALRSGHPHQYAIGHRRAWGEAVLRHLEGKLGPVGERIPPADPLGEPWTSVVFLGFVAGLLQDWEASDRPPPEVRSP